MVNVNNDTMAQVLMQTVSKATYSHSNNSDTIIYGTMIKLLIRFEANS